jgi:hypothetical protein
MFPITPRYHVMILNKTPPMETPTYLEHFAS